MNAKVWKVAGRCRMNLKCKTLWTDYVQSCCITSSSEDLWLKTVLLFISANSRNSGRKTKVVRFCKRSHFKLYFVERQMFTEVEVNLGHPCRYICSPSLHCGWSFLLPREGWSPPPRRQRQSTAPHPEVQMSSSTVWLFETSESPSHLRPRRPTKEVQVKVQTIISLQMV